MVEHKKSQMEILVALIIAVVVMLLLVTTLAANRERLTSASEDLACQTYLQVYDNLAVEYLDLKDRILEQRSIFAEFSKYCKTERIFIEHKLSDQSSRDEIYDKYATHARKCWERYGSGDLKFLRFTQREGSYCFVCARVTFEDKENEAFKYRDLGSWMSDEENSPSYKNDNAETFQELSHLFYVDSANGEELDLSEFDFKLSKDQIEELGEFQETYAILEDSYDYYAELYDREIRSDEESYIVFRYHLDDSYYEQVQSAAITGAVAFGSSAVGRLAAKQAACWATAGVALASVFAAPAAPVISAFCTVTGVYSGAKIAVRSVKVKNRATELYKKKEEAMKSFKVPGKSNIPPAIQERVDETAEILEVAADIDRKHGDKNFLVYAKTLRESGQLNDLKRFDNVLDSNGNPIASSKIFPDSKLLDSNGVPLSSSEGKVMSLILDSNGNPLSGVAGVETLRKRLNIPTQVIDDIKKTNPDALKPITDSNKNGYKVSDYIRMTKIILGAYSAYLIYDLISGDNIPSYDQYVEIIPESQFYHQCGVVPNHENS